MIAVAVLALAVAAPVPKESDAQKLEDVYGKVVDPDSKCKCELTKEGSLQISVPNEQMLLILDHHVLPPIHATKRIDGDFELVVRVAHAPVKDAGNNRNNLTSVVAVSAGIAVSGEGGSKDCSVFVQYHQKKSDAWVSGFVHYTNHPKGSNGHDTGASKYDEKPAWLRVTRIGETITSETSADGKK